MYVFIAHFFLHRVDVRLTVATTVGSLIRALASSLGLKRTMTKSTSASTSSKSSATSQFSQPHTLNSEDDLSQNSKPYSDLPLPDSYPQTDHFRP